jgi:hypothetical protein
MAIAASVARGCAVTATSFFKETGAGALVSYTISQEMSVKANEQQAIMFLNLFIII